MKRIVFLLEEYSMKVFLERLLPRLYPGLDFLCVAHEGKGDLEKSLPKTLRAWREPGVSFVVVRDQDGGDCRALKARLVALCTEGRQGESMRPGPLVRIACQELEAWYLGEPSALAHVFAREDLKGLGAKARFRDPDSVAQPAAQLEKLVPEFQKVSGARLLGGRLTRDGNRSRSFQAFLVGVDRLAKTIVNSKVEGEDRWH